MPWPAARLQGAAHHVERMVPPACFPSAPALAQRPAPAPTCLQCTPKSSILSSGMVWYSLGPSSRGLYPYGRQADDAKSSGGGRQRRRSTKKPPCHHAWPSQCTATTLSAPSYIPALFALPSHLWESAERADLHLACRHRAVRVHDDGQERLLRRPGDELQGVGRGSAGRARALGCAESQVSLPRPTGQLGTGLPRRGPPDTSGWSSGCLRLCRTASSHSLGGCGTSPRCSPACRTPAHTKQAGQRGQHAWGAAGAQRSAECLHTPVTAPQKACEATHAQQAPRLHRLRKVHHVFIALSGRVDPRLGPLHRQREAVDDDELVAQDLALLRMWGELWGAQAPRSRASGQQTSMADWRDAQLRRATCRSSLPTCMTPMTSMLPPLLACMAILSSASADILTLRPSARCRQHAGRVPPQCLVAVRCHSDPPTPPDRCPALLTA